MPRPIRVGKIAVARLPTRMRIATRFCPPYGLDLLAFDLLEELARDAERIDGRRRAGVAADLQEDLADLGLGDAVAQRAAQMRAQLMRPVEDRDHRQVEHAARLERQTLATPDSTPAVFVEDVLERLIEVVDVLERVVDILVAQHLAADAESLVVHGLVHGGSSVVAARGALGGRGTLPDRGWRCHLRILQHAPPS